MKNDKRIGSKIKELCDKYKFKTIFSGINDNFSCEVHSNNTDGNDVIWFEIQLSNHDSSNGKPFEPVLTIYGNTDQSNIWLCDTRKDLSLKNIIDFCKSITEICNLKLTTVPTTKDNEIYIHRLVDIEDLQEIKGFNSLEEINSYLNKEEQDIKDNDKNFKYTHWLKIDLSNETKKGIEWNNLKIYKEKYDCNMEVYYYDNDSFCKKVIKLECNQPYKDLDLDINSMFDGSLIRLASKPRNISLYKVPIETFFENKIAKELKNYNNLHSIISDITDISKNKISVDLDVYSNFKIITSYKIELDLSQMGITSDMDYAFQLSKDLSNKIAKYYDKNNKLPSIKELENEMHLINYFIIELPVLEREEEYEK